MSDEMVKFCKYAESKDCRFRRLLWLEDMICLISLIIGVLAIGSVVYVPFNEKFEPANYIYLILIIEIVLTLIVYSDVIDSDDGKKYWPVRKRLLLCFIVAIISLTIGIPSFITASGKNDIIKDTIIKETEIVPESIIINEEKEIITFKTIEGEQIVTSNFIKKSKNVPKKVLKHKRKEYKGIKNFNIGTFVRTFYELK